MFRSVRTRLTLWYMAVLALVLVIFSIGVYVSLARYMYAQLDYEINNTVEGTQVSLLRKFAEGETIIKAATDALDEHIGPRQAAAVFDADGSLIAESTAMGEIHASLPQMNSLQANQLNFFTTPGTNGTYGRRVGVKSSVASSPSKGYLIVVSQPLDEVVNQLKTVRLILVLA